MVSPCRSGSVARMPTRRRINDEDQGQLTLLSATAAVHGLSVLGQSVAAQRGGGLRQEGFLLGLAALASLDFTGGMPAPLVRRGFVQSCFYWLYFLQIKEYVFSLYASSSASTSMLMTSLGSFLLAKSLNHLPLRRN